MAKALNRTRIRDTRIILALCFALVLLTKQLIHDDTPLHEICELIGNLLIAVCVIGRIYATAFLGGHKNATLITYGPFSVTRNPLYFFSFIGACGIALMSNHLVLLILLPALYCAVFFSVIRREERFLIEEFGDEYVQYCKTTPRFFPRLSLYNAPESVPMVPRFLLKSLKDAALWFLALPFFELVEWLHEMHYINPLFTLY